LWLLASAFALLSLNGCRRATPSEAPATGLIAVATQIVQLESLQSTIAGPGIVIPAAAGDWTIFPPETGRIAELPKAEGEIVKPGDAIKFGLVAAQLVDAGRLYDLLQFG